jgi:membrane protease YdiL (CAAX protease family)
VKRIIQFPLVRIIIALALLIGVIALLVFAFRPMRSFVSPELLALIALGAILLLLSATYWAYVHFVEQRPVTELDPSYAPGELMLGVVFGAGLFAAVIAVLARLGDYHLRGIATWSLLILPLLNSIQSSYMEEIVFRGVLFRIIEEWLGTWVSLTLTAVLFGALHLLNKNATVMGAVAIALTAGIILGAAYTATNRLWLPIGLHFGWNFTEGGIFGLSVSGGKAEGLLQSQLTGPELLTGGAFGPEASIVTVALGLVMGAAMLAYAWRRGRIHPLGWRTGTSPAAETA